MTKEQKLTLHEFSGEPSLAHIMTDGLIQVPELAVVLPISTFVPSLKRQDRTHTWPRIDPSVPSIHSHLGLQPQIRP
jgi:hypothetical protein